MIDISQWRASIGLWNYYQAASNRPANGCHSHSFKDVVDSKSGSTTSGEKTSKLPAALSLIAFLLLFYLLTLLRHILMIAPTGNCYQVQCTTGVTVADTNYVQSVVLPGGSSSNLIYNDLYLIVCLRMILLLSGDVELNPGPTIDDRPDISLLIQWLEPLVDWKRFGLCLVGMKEHHTSKIEQEKSKIEDRKLELYSKWLSVNPNATWRDVIGGLTSIKENTLAQDIKEKVASDTLSSSPRTQNSDESHLHLQPDKVDNDLDAVFKKIYPYYDFVDCSLIADMCIEFISDEKDLLDDLNTYLIKADEFCSSEPISELKKKICKVCEPYKNQLENMPSINIKVQNRWHNVKIKVLYILIKSLIPEEFKQSVMKCITVRKGCIIITLRILNFTADSLIEYSAKKREFMHLIGIFSLHIDDHLVLQEDENMNFTFELALLEAVTVCNYEVVEFLLQLETVNIDHTSEGKTALMLACEKGHEDIVDSLLSAGANVNIQDNNGWTALMIASEHNHISIIHTLLQANANSHLKTSNELNALMIASHYVELLLKKQEVIDNLNAQEKNGWNAFIFACQNGYTQIVELLLKEQQVINNLNAQVKDGANAFLLACQNGHTQIVKLLLKKQVDLDAQRNDGVNAFML
uniref:Uncharacterized protein n=1 Tax=Amphimedon queenslandica TaxID=400682 RepID=A0A1X7TAR5_AMPQE